MSREIFSRYELKYLIKFDQYERLVQEISWNTRFDRYGNEEGKYNIVSLYFDSPDHAIYYETRNRLRFRQKLRLRIYNEVSLDDTAYLEIKQKFRNVVNKRRTAIALKDAYAYLNHAENGFRHFRADVSNEQIFKEVDYFKSAYNLRPEVIVSYDRQAFQGIAEPDLRITFDYHLRCRQENLRIEHGPEGEFFVDPDLVIMEVKVNQSVPFWLARLLSRYECAKKSVSKYCTSVELLQLIGPSVQRKRAAVSL
jgi:hypothetical protein